MSESSQEHLHQAAGHAKANPARGCILTVSDTRTAETDRGGPLIEQKLTDAGHEILARRIVRDDPQAIRGQLEQWAADPAIQVILTTGGTGLARRDSTVEIVRDLLDVEIEGFGELFRMLSYAEVQAAAMLSRAVAGLVIRRPDAGGDTYIFALPGSTNAITLALDKLIVPQLAHLIWERSRQRDG